MTVTVTARLCAVVILLDAGETVTVGVVRFCFVPPPPELPPPHASIERKTAERITTWKRPANRFIQKPPLTLSAN
jgi:hypothetical protein